MKILNTKKYVLILIALLVIDCSLGGFIGYWRDWYWTAVQAKELHLWLKYIAEFIIVCLASCFISGFTQYISNVLSLRFRTELTRKAWKLNNYEKIEGGHQRIQEDCLSYPTLVINLATGCFRSIVMIVVFSIILLSTLPWYYLIFPFLYALIGTGLAAKIAKPLIDLNYINQVFEAKFRQVLTKLNYKDVHRNNYNLFRVTKFLQYFQSFYNQITIIIPHCILFSLYFSAAITFGVFMQIAASMVEIINNLSFIINSFADINKLLSCNRRLKELKII